MKLKLPLKFLTTSSALVILILLVSILILIKYFNNINEGFQKFNTLNSYGNYPDEETNLLLNSYPVSFDEKNNLLSNASGITLMNSRPIYEVGNFTQATNNLKYPINPDNGSCTPASLCGIYNNKCHGPNIITPLPPVDLDPKNQVRIGYFLA